MSAEYRICFSRTGGPDVLERVPLEPLLPAAEEVLVRHEAIGLNFIDTYYRTGLYPAALPSGLGQEAAGVIEAVGSGVSQFRAGDRVAYITQAPGAYATARLVPAARIALLPDTIGFAAAAATMLKGCTAEFLIERCANVQSGDWVLVHAAAGGVGSILVPWLKAIGANVIAHAGTTDKAELARASGALHALACPMDALAGEVRRITDGEGVRAVFDGVGATSWQASLASVARRGLVVSYGNASGPVPAFAMLDLLRAGSIFVTRPTLFDYIANHEDYRASTQRLFAMIEHGAVTVQIGAEYPLADVADAHRALETRTTTGSTVLTP